MKTFVSRFSIARPRRRASTARPLKDAVVAAAFAAALFALIAVLDGAAGPNDISPGTAFAATLPAVTPATETWSADTSAEGTRPDAIH